MSRARIVRSARDSRGAVLVFVALVLPVVIGVGGLAVDVGNWFSHKRHLQVQADAGALAGAGKFRVPCDATVDAAIKLEAAKYSSVEYAGPGYTPGPGYNPQTGGTPQAQLFREINSKTFHNQSFTDDTTTGDPCTAKMLDVKLTETDLPWYLKAIKVPFVNAQARVEIKKKVTSAGALPVGVPEVGVTKAKALFVDEVTGNVIAQKELTRAGTVGGVAIWSNSAAPVSTPIGSAAAKIGVRIVLSGGPSLTCGEPLVDCYGAGTSSAIVAGRAGLVAVRGYDDVTAGTATAPQARKVSLVGSSCESGFFTVSTSSCTISVEANVDWGSSPPPLSTTRITAMRDDAPVNTQVDLAPPPPPATGPTPTGTWSGPAITVAAGEGGVPIRLRWKTGCPTDLTTKCTNPEKEGSFGVVQRAFAGADDLTVSGPIKSLSLFEGATSPANSFPFPACSGCSQPDLVVKVGLKSELTPTTVAGCAPNVFDAPCEPLVVMKVAGGGSQNQALDCDPAKPNLVDELSTGCAPPYTINDGAANCPAGMAELKLLPAPWKCVTVSTGAAVGQVTRGMNLRILGQEVSPPCTKPNNWPLYPNLPDGDPRIVSVFLTPYGAFTGSGGNTVPVIGFADFYVTGWDGGGCQGAGDDTAGSGAIVGHYIKDIDSLGSAGGGTEFCDFNSLGSCVAQFTR